MAWSKKIPKLSLVILLLTYGVEGWMYSSWIDKILERGAILSMLTEDIHLVLIYGAAIVNILFLVVLFVSPISLIASSLDGWLKSDTRAFMSILLGAFAFALIVQRVDYFARFLVFVAAALLFKLDLQLAGYSRWLGTLILTIFCLLGFAGGILAFHTWR